jgi:cytochrome c biogenesis protein
MQLEVYPDGAEAPVSTTVVSQGTPATVAGLSMTFVRELPFTGLIVAHDPGAVFVWIGSALMIIGLFLVFFFPHRRVWVSAHATAAGSEIRVASAMRRDSAFESQFHRLVGDIQRSATSSPAPTHHSPEPIHSAAEGRAE